MPSSLSTTLSSLSLTCLTPQARSTSVTQPSYSPLLPLSSSSPSSPFAIFILHDSVQLVVDTSLSSSKEHFCHVTVLLPAAPSVLVLSVVSLRRHRLSDPYLALPRLPFRQLQFLSFSFVLQGSLYLEVLLLVRTGGVMQIESRC